MAMEAMGSVAGPLNRLIGAGSLVGLGDGELLERFLADRDEEAFAAVVARHGPMVLRVCRGVLRNRCDAEDAFQATYLILVRKARSLRGREDVGGWLHRVAYRVSIQANADAARRRERERTAGELAPAAMSLPAEVDEVTAAVHEELARLPEAVRAALLLCELRGVPQPEAAAALRTSERTLRRRLVQGRERLRARLARRGFAGGEEMWAAFRLPEGRDIVSPAWQSATARAAVEILGPTTSVRAASVAAMRLAGEVTHARFATGGAILAACLLGIGLTGWAASAHWPGRWGDGPEPAAPVVVRPDGSPDKLVSGPTRADTILVRGQVVDPDGKPVAGATVRELWFDKETPEATSGPDGKFVVRIHRPDSYKGAGVDWQEDTFTLLARAPGFGLGWLTEEYRLAEPATCQVRLAPDGPPIEGRILEEDGRPVVGAHVDLVMLWYARDERTGEPAPDGLVAWLDRIRGRELRGNELHDNLGQLAPRIAATTDGEGRFRITGIGRGRLADMDVSGPTIARSRIFVGCREDEEVRAIDGVSGDRGPVIFHTPKFDHVVARSRPIEGTVRDRDTGRPIAGIEVVETSSRMDRFAATDAVATTTDAQGRYRLEGLNLAESYRLMLHPGAGLPYPGVAMTVAGDPRASGPVSFDIPLKRGVLVRGRVTDKATGRAVDCRIEAAALADNPHLREFPGYAESPHSFVATEGDGRFEIVALPGRNVIGCSAIFEDYRYDKQFQPLPETLPPLIGGFHRVAVVDLAPGSETANVDMQLDPGRAVRLQVIDPDGKPVAGAAAWGLSPIWVGQPDQGPTIDVHALAVGEPRRVAIWHKDRRLAATVVLRGDEAGPLTIRLEPTGTITGRLVDGKGQAQAGRELKNVLLSPDESGPKTQDSPRASYFSAMSSDASGRFRIEGMIPGLVYQVSTRKDSRLVAIRQDTTVRSGEVKDLGDIVVPDP